MESYPLNFKITNCLKNLTPSISRVRRSLPVSRMTSFSFLKRFASSVVGNTFTSPRMPWVCVITPTCSSSFLSVPKSSAPCLFFQPHHPAHISRAETLSHDMRRRPHREIRGVLLSDDLYIHSLIVL